MLRSFISKLIIFMKDLDLMKCLIVCKKQQQISYLQMNSSQCAQDDIVRFQEEIQDLSKELEIKSKMLKIQKDVNSSLEDREKMYKSKLTLQQKKIQELNQELEQAVNRTQIVGINHDSQIKSLEEEKYSLGKAVDNYQNIAQEQKEQNIRTNIKINDMSSIVGSSWRQQPSEISEMSLPILLNVQKDKKREKNKIESIQPITIAPVIRMKKPQRPKRVQIQAKPVEEIHQHSNILQELKKNQDSLQQTIKNNRKILDCDDDDIQMAPRVIPLNKKIMCQISNHYDEIPADKKWQFLHMMCGWAEFKMQSIYTSIQQMDI